MLDAVKFKTSILVTAVMAFAVITPLVTCTGCGEKKADANARIESAGDGSNDVVTVGDGVHTTKHLSARERAKDK